MKNKNIFLITLSILFLLSVFVINTKSVNADYCTDSDGGINYPVRGTATMVRFNNTNLSYTDYCISSSNIQEYFCVNNFVTSTSQNCRNQGYSGCTRGRCYGNINQTNTTGSGSPLFLKNTQQQGPQLFRSPSRQTTGNLVNTTTCTIWAVPSQDIGPFTSNVTAAFSNSTGPWPYTAILRCFAGDPGTNHQVWGNVPNGGLITRLCNYPQVNQQTVYQASASGDGALCITSIIDNPQPATCVDTDGGRNYPVRGTTFTNQTNNYTDSCQDNLNLKEYFCFNNNQMVGNEIVNCRNIGYKNCNLGKCYNTTGGSGSPSFMKIYPTSTKSRFFLWALLDIFRGRPTGNAVMEIQNPKENNIFSWILVAVIFVAGLMYMNNKDKQGAKNSESRERSSRNQRSSRRR